MLSLPGAIIDSIYSHADVQGSINIFLYLAFLTIPVVCIFMSLLHLILYQAKKRNWFELKVVYVLAVGLSLSLVYLCLTPMIGHLSSDLSWQTPLMFLWLAVIYQIASGIMRKLNWWTL
ncbi:MAG: hypothetical protein ACJ77K_00210 [Bacteroidia bacterium]